MMTRPPHVARVYERYGVTTRRALLRAVRDTFNEMFVEEGEERFTLRDAEVLLDREFSAEYERLYGGAYEEAARSSSWARRWWEGYERSWRAADDW